MVRWRKRRAYEVWYAVEVERMLNCNSVLAELLLRRQFTARILRIAQIRYRRRVRRGSPDAGWCDADYLHRAYRAKRGKRW